MNLTTLTPEEAAKITMEQFDAFTSAELRSIPDNAWVAIRPEVRRNCADCAHLKAAVSWWCSNPEAIKFRGTKIPGTNRCPFWSAPQPPSKLPSPEVIWPELVMIMFILVMIFPVIMFLFF